MNRKRECRISVINNHTGKTEQQHSYEKILYERFFKNHVEYLQDKSFEDFANAPFEVIDL